MDELPQVNDIIEVVTAQIALDLIKQAREKIEQQAAEIERLRDVLRKLANRDNYHIQAYVSEEIEIEINVPGWPTPWEYAAKSISGEVE